MLSMDILGIFLVSLWTFLAVVCVVGKVMLNWTMCGAGFGARFQLLLQTPCWWIIWAEIHVSSRFSPCEGGLLCFGIGSVLKKEKKD
ncbi:unnamed protein product [Cuscuta campestris]|uniref:Uncharacterized protein n=1 Tax=Cuscuta campestris TaxID=132261 RepID=A0A484LAT5_9ASTE|nr:unnamed protein product [Cuscuta campestris]